MPNVDVNLGFKLAKVEPKKVEKKETPEPKKEETKPEKKEEKKAEVKQITFNKKCPVSSKDVDPAKLFAINFCCGNCLADFTKAPAKHIAKVKGPDNKKCPISGKDIDESKQFVIGFCCGNCLAEFHQGPGQAHSQGEKIDGRTISLKSQMSLEAHQFQYNRNSLTIGERCKLIAAPALQFSAS